MDKLRTRLILAHLREHRSCTLAELMAQFHVSSATIHRDVAELARRDAVTRVRGGLLFNEPGAARDDAAPYLDRVVANHAGKRAAAEAAVKVITEGDIVFLDSSTTVYELAHLLRAANLAHLTLVTNSVAIIQNFRKFPPHYVLIGLGGNYDPHLNSMLGAETFEQLSRVTITKAFVSAFGVNSDGVTTNHERQAELLRKVLAAAERRYLLVDRSKLGRTGLYRLYTRNGFDAVFTG